MPVCRRALRHCGLPWVLFVLWLINLSIFMLHYRDSMGTDVQHQEKQQTDEEYFNHCPSPYGYDVVENIKKVWRKHAVSSHVRHYLEVLGLDVHYGKNSSGLRLRSQTSVTISHPTVVLAASSNHFLEIQALLHNLHTVANKKGHLKVVFFDLGLQPHEHDLMVRHCQCEVRYFKFNLFPAHVQDLAIFSWKPIVIQQALQEFGFVMYMDASIRLLHGNLQQLFDSARHQGIMVIPGDQDTYKVVEHTDPRTFAFLGEKPCYFDGIPERQAGFLLMTNNRILQHVIMVPWLDCALSLECIAPQGSKARWFCSLYRHFYGECHRFDQSVFNIVLSRIYYNETTVPAISHKFYKVDRNDKMNYFERL